MAQEMSEEEEEEEGEAEEEDKDHTHQPTPSVTSGTHPLYTLLNYQHI